MTDTSRSISQILHDIATSINFIEQDLMYASKPAKTAKWLVADIQADMNSPQFVDWLASRDGFTVWRFTILSFEMDDMQMSLEDIDDDDPYYPYCKPSTIESDSKTTPIPADLTTNMMFPFLEFPEKSWYFVSHWIRGLAGAKNEDIRNDLRGQQLELFDLLQNGKPWVQYDEILFAEIVRSNKSSVGPKATVTRALERLKKALGTDVYDLVISESEGRAKLIDIRQNQPDYQSVSDILP